MTPRLLLIAVAVTLAAPATAPAAVKLGEGNWTYFTDPRVVSSRDAVYTGWISTSGRVTVAKFDPATRRRRTVVVGRTGVDDHNNPALHMRADGRLMVFFSPHSGRFEPKDRVSRMYYRIAARPHSISRWGPTMTVPVNAAGRLGYTYPNPIALPGGRLWLSWRGGGWLPTYSIYKSGQWSAAQEIVRGSNGHRPYAKYAAGRGGTVHLAFTQAHPELQRTNVYYLRYSNGEGFYAADGKLAGSGRDLPMHVSRADLVQPYDDEEGRAWVMDVADDRTGHPVIVYSVGFWRSRQAFKYARWNGERWVRSTIASAFENVRGARVGRFQTGGIVLDHRDPRIVYLTRVIGTRARVEQWRTPDGGGSWELVRQLSPEGQNCFRPAAPVSGTSKVVLFVCGRISHWQRFKTRITAAVIDQ